MPQPQFPFLPDESREPEPTALRIFQIEEESSAGGPYPGYSCCWVTKESEGFYLYGNELGCMAGPCKTADEALNISMFQFSMEHWNILCYLELEELARILVSPAFILSNVGGVIINGIVAPATTVQGIVDCYKQWRRGRIMDITVIFGPPGPAELQQRIEKRHEETGTPKDKLWVELIHLTLEDLNTRSSLEEPSAIDELFSGFIKRTVIVHGLFLTYMLMGGIQSPAFRFYPDKISNEVGWPIDLDWSKQEYQKALSLIFGILVKSEWVRLSIAYEP